MIRRPVYSFEVSVLNHRVLLLPFVGLLAAAALLEVATRIRFYPEGPGREFDTSFRSRTPRWIPHPFLPYAGPPDATITTENDDGSTERIVTNSYGFRTHDFPENQDPDEFRVLCFGESTTYGYKAPDNEHTWPGLLESRLRREYPGKKISVFNLGMDMATSDFSVVNLALIGVHLQPNLVIVYHGCNDVTVANAANYRWDHSHVFRDLDVSGARGVQARLPAWLLQSQAILVASGTVDRWLGNLDLYELATRPFPPADNPGVTIPQILVNLRTLHSLATGVGSEILFSTFQFREGDVPLFRQYNETLRAEFQREGWHWVDQDGLLPDRDERLQVDSCHFSQAGRERLAENFFDAIVASDLAP